MRGEGAFGNLERKEGQREERVGVGKKREVERWGEEKIRRRDRDMDMESVALCPKRETDTKDGTTSDAVWMFC